MCPGRTRKKVVGAKGFEPSTFLLTMLSVQNEAFPAWVCVLARQKGLPPNRTPVHNGELFFITLLQAVAGSTGTEFFSCFVIKRDAAARWKSDFNYVVAHSEEDDCAGFGWPRTLRARDFAANGNDGGSGATYGLGESSAAALLQSAQKTATPVT